MSDRDFDRNFDREYDDAINDIAGMLGLNEEKTRQVMNSEVLLVLDIGTVMNLQAGLLTLMELDPQVHALLWPTYQTVFNAVGTQVIDLIDRVRESDE